MTIETDGLAESVAAVDENWSEPQAPERFSVRDDATANWLIRKICEAREYAQRCAEWAEREKRRAQRDEEFFWMRYGPQLRAFVKQKIVDAGGRRKSIQLPAGTAGFRNEPARLVVDDDEAVIAWCRAHHPEMVSVVERLSKSALNAHVEKTGELPNSGVHIEPEHERFYVR
jgi:phage host-nuclease inhibitor protein Gam